MKDDPAWIKDACANLLHGPVWPERPFLTHGAASHAELYQLAARLYQRLASQSKTTQDPVCLASDDKFLCAAAILCALAGGPPILMPYALSGQAMDALHSATGFRRAITSKGLVPLPDSVENIQVPDDLPLRSQPLPDRLNKGTLLYLFTGGSTGTPQLWSKTADNLLGEALFIARHHGITKEDRIAATISSCHIYGLLYSVILPLVCGSAVVAKTPVFPDEISKKLDEEQASVLISVPAHFRALRDKPLNNSVLRLAFSSAGRLEKDDNDTFCQANNLGITEIYGSTETGGIATRNRFHGEHFFSILPGVDWQIGTGERLQVHSPFLSPELPRDKAGYFQTADRVQNQGKNRFSLLGRVDAIAKVAGKRVDMEEIRFYISQLPEVRDCLVLALPDSGSRGNRIVAIIESDSSSPEFIRKHLGQCLEPYALPKVLKLVIQMPMKANGKYDRAAILALVSS